MGYKEPRKAISRHCKHGTKHPIGVITGVRDDGTNITQEVETTIIPEGDMYRLITKSQLPSAEQFEEWIMDEILPTLRKTGEYKLHKEGDKPNTELEQIATNIFGQLDNKIEKLDEYYRPRHKTKLNLNKFIKDCLGDNATKEHCKIAKKTLLTILGNYDIYEEVPIDILQNADTLARLYDICKNINLSINKGIEIN